MAWRWTALIVYLVICIYDFVVVPVWFGLNRPDLSTFVSYITTIKDPLVQLELMKKEKQEKHGIGKLVKRLVKNIEINTKHLKK